MGTLPELLASWGWAGAFLLALLDSAGVPLPAGVDLYVIGLAIALPRQAFWGATAAITGSVIGNWVLFWLARKGGKAYLERHLKGERAARLRQRFDQYGLVTVFVPAAVPVPLPLKVFVLCSGALGVSAQRFLWTVALARLIRYAGLAWLALQLGDGTLGWLANHSAALAAVAAGAAILFVLILRRSQHRQQATPVSSQTGVD